MNRMILTLMLTTAIAASAAELYVVETASGSYSGQYPADPPPPTANVPRVRLGDDEAACGANEEEGFGCNFISYGRFQSLVDDYRIEAEKQIEAYRAHLDQRLAGMDAELTPEVVIPELIPLQGRVEELRAAVETAKQAVKDTSKEKRRELKTFAQGKLLGEPTSILPGNFQRTLMAENPTLNSFALARMVNGASLFPHAVVVPGHQGMPIEPFYFGVFVARTAIDFTPAGALPDLIELMTGSSVFPPFKRLNHAERASAALGVFLANREMWYRAGLLGDSVFISLKNALGDQHFDPASWNAGAFAVVDQVLWTSASIRYYGPGTGPLASKPFRNDSYTESVTNGPVKLYRVHHGPSDMLTGLNGFWSRTRPERATQVSFDQAFRPSINPSGARFVEITVPAGTTLYEGAVAPVFREGVDLLCGGFQTVVGPEVPAEWITNEGSL